MEAFARECGSYDFCDRRNARRRFGPPAFQGFVGCVPNSETCDSEFRTSSAPWGLWMVVFFETEGVVSPWCHCRGVPELASPSQKCARQNFGASAPQGFGGCVIIAAMCASATSGPQGPSGSNSELRGCKAWGFQEFFRCVGLQGAYGSRCMCVRTYVHT